MITIENNEQRTGYRRYADRRAALMLVLHEALFANPPGKPRDRLILAAIRQNFETDRAALVIPKRSGASCAEIHAATGEWIGMAEGRQLAGPGLTMLFDLHRATPGTLTLARVKRPSAFLASAWEGLWTTDLGSPAQGLLSAAIHPKKAGPSFLWLQQTSYSREWSSRDRELAEEVTALLGKAADKALNGC